MKYKTCKNDGCRKKVRNKKELFCKSCLEDPFNCCIKITDEELIRFMKSDYEIRLNKQNIVVLDYKIKELFSSIEELNKIKTNLKNNNDIEFKKYNEVVDELCEKYNIDKKKFVVDTDTKIIRSGDF